MIFNCKTTEEKELTENEKVKAFIESAVEHDGDNTGFIFKSYYDEETNEIILNDLYCDENGIIYEANISQKDLGVKKSKNNSNPRYIMITGSDESSHGGRMKVSINGKHINPNNKNQYISIYRKDDNTISYIGNLNDIKMDKKEYKIYEDLFLRNEDLIWSIYFNRGAFGSLPDEAIIRDERLRNEGFIVKRDRYTGDASIYDDNGNFIRSENIKGDVI